MEESFTQHGGASSLSFFTLLVYALAMGIAGYFAWKYVANEESALKKYGIVAGSVVGAWLAIFLLRALTFNL